MVAAGRPVVLPHSAERVIAYLALTDRPVTRARVGGSLWFDATERQAANNLSTALWRVRQAGGDLVRVMANRLTLSARVDVDVVELSALCRRLLHEPRPDDLGEVFRLVECDGLLPSWDDPWVDADRERFRLLRLEALEQAASRLMAERNLEVALLAAMASATAEPLRESSRRLLVELHVRKGNLAEALRSYADYRLLLRSALGVEPSRLMQQMVEPLNARPHRYGPRRSAGRQ